MKGFPETRLVHLIIHLCSFYYMDITCTYRVPHVYIYRISHVYIQGTAWLYTRYRMRIYNVPFVYIQGYLMRVFMVPHVYIKGTAWAYNLQYGLQAES